MVVGLVGQGIVWEMASVVCLLWSSGGRDGCAVLFLRLAGQRGFSRLYLGGGRNYCSSASHTVLCTLCIVYCTLYNGQHT